MKVTRCQIKQLLDARSGVIKYAKENIIALSALGQTIDLSEQLTKLILIEVAHHRAECLLGGNGQDGATHSGQGWFSPRHISKESLNTG
jgi:hypothetical protein